VSTPLLPNLERQKRLADCLYFRRTALFKEFMNRSRKLIRAVLCGIGLAAIFACTTQDINAHSDGLAVAHLAHGTGKVDFYFNSTSLATGIDDGEGHPGFMASGGGTVRAYEHGTSNPLVEQQITNNGFHLAVLYGPTTNLRIGVVPVHVASSGRGFNTFFASDLPGEFDLYVAPLGIDWETTERVNVAPVGASDRGAVRIGVPFGTMPNNVLAIETDPANPAQLRIRTVVIKQ
jgi:hypothetical protein